MKSLVSRLLFLIFLIGLTASSQAALVGHWPADGNTNDVVGGNNGNAVGLVSYTQGISGQAFLFDGSSYVSIPGAGKYQFGTSDFSVSFWVRVDASFASSVDLGGMVSKDSYGVQPDYQGWLFNICRFCSNPGWGIEVRQVPGVDINARMPGLSAGTWYHFVGVRRSSNVEFYLNGAISMTEGAVPANVSNDAEMVIGALSIGARQFLIGAIDDIRVYDTALSAADVAALYAPPAPTFPFTGFLQPVDNSPTLNVIKAGSAIPVKFSLGGDRGLSILAAGFPTSQATACNLSNGTGVIEETVTTNSSGLSYDATSGQYNYVWKTDKAWVGTCRQLTLKLTDGTTHTALFQFSK
jgi:hypothetical protein